MRQDELRKSSQNRLSRRRFMAATTLAAAGAALPTATLPAAAQTPQSPAARPILAYVGTYSSPQGPEGSRGHGRGIYLYALDPASGALALREVFANDDNPAWLALNPERTRLYSGNETNTYRGAGSGSVSAYAIDRSTGRLSLINTVGSGAPARRISASTRPASTCWRLTTPAGRWPFCRWATMANSARPATLSTARAKLRSPRRNAPRGSFAISGHDAPHMHMIQSDPDGRFVVATDLGRDRIFVWKFDASRGRLLEHDPPYVELPPGDGPRHFAFHPNGRWFYCLQEEGSTVAFFSYDAEHGRLTHKQTISSLPKGFTGTNFTSEILVTPDGKFVYAANRLHDTIAWFSIADNGELTLRGEQPTSGNYPRSFNIDPNANFLFSCNQRSDAIAAFRRDKTTGKLTFTGHYTPVGTPAAIVFLT